MTVLQGQGLLSGRHGGRVLACKVAVQANDPSPLHPNSKTLGIDAHALGHAPHLSLAWLSWHRVTETSAAWSTKLPCPELGMQCVPWAQWRTSLHVMTWLWTAMVCMHVRARTGCAHARKAGALTCMCTCNHGRGDVYSGDSPRL